MKRLPLFFAVLYAVSLALILGWMTYRYLATRAERISGAGNAYIALRQEIIGHYRDGNRLDTDYFSVTLRSEFLNSENLVALGMYSPERGIRYFLVRDRTIAPFIDNPPWPAKPDYKIDEIRYRVFSDPLNIPSDPTLSMDMVFRILSDSDAFAILKEGFFAGLILVILIGITLLLLSFGKKQAGTPADVASADGMPPTDSFLSPGTPAPDDEAPSRESDVGSFPGTAAYKDDGPAWEPAAFPELKRDDDDFRLPSEEPIAEPAVVDLEEKPLPSEERTTGSSVHSDPSGMEPSGNAQQSGGTETAAADRRAEGLFSPLSGMGWPEYLERRLDAELQRNASFDQELVLALFRTSWADSAGRREVYSETAAFFLECFTFADLSFEYEGTGFAIVLPNMDIDHVIRKVNHLFEKLAEVYEGKIAAEPPIALWAGLSCRNGRLLSGRTLLEEARAALERSVESDGSGLRIVTSRDE